jgi:predicted ATPase
MFTDMVGFTALMQADELLGRERRSQYIHAVEHHHDIFSGTIVKRMGDGTMSRFPSSLDAVLAAVEIQRELVAQDISVRIGVHVGEVIVEEGDLVGDAANIASRIESFAVPGGVMLSDTAYDQLRNRTDISVVSLGKFRLKNVGRPFELFGVAAEGVVVPNPNALEGKGERYASLPSNLPLPSTSLLGRDADLSALEELVRDHRVVTIVGPGGTGKTRLAVELGRRLAPVFLDGVSFVAMADVRDPADFMPTIAAALDVKEAEERSLGDGVAALIGDKRALVLLDNLEQVVAAAPNVAALADRCPGLRIVVTSRAPLRIAAEWEFPLSMLELPAVGTEPSAKSALEYSAVAFFVDRARVAKPSFELTDENAGAVVGICRRLDGLPLALELAAPRLRLLSAQALYERLGLALNTLASGPRDSPERHQTLRATIDRSHSLLTGAEQRLFRRMAVFVGGSTLVDLEAIVACPGEVVLNELQSLVDQALVQVDAQGDRFSTLQTVSEYAAERLAAAGEADEIFLRHAYQYASLTEVLRDGIEGDGLIRALEKGVVEEGNIQAALDTLLVATRTGDAASLELGLRTCGNLLMYWHIRGKNVSARERTVAFLVEDRVGTATIGRSRAIITAGLALWMIGDFARAIDEWTESYQIANALNAPRERCITPFLLGLGCLGLGDATGRTWAEESIERSRAEGFLWAEGFALTVDGMFRSLAGDQNQAEAQFAAALAIQQGLGDEEGVGLSLGGLAALAAGRDDLDTALDLYRQSLDAFEVCGDRAEEARIIAELAWTQLRQGTTGLARLNFLASVQAYTDVGSVRGVGIALTGLATTEAAEGRLELAVQLATAAEIYAMEEGIVNVYSDENQGREFIEQARSALSEEAAARAAETGRALSIGDALALVRSN